MKIKEIYSKLEIPDNLQKHMTWVAGLSMEIYNNWTGPTLDKSALLQSCLFHDIAKVISFSDRDETVEKIYQSLVNKYGNDEHEACNKICKEYGLSSRALEIIRNNNVSPFIVKAKYVLNSDDYEHKILRYADSRVSINGVVTLIERGEEYFVRNPGKTRNLEAEVISNRMEEQIQTNTSFDVREINHSNCERHSEYLLNLEI